MARSDESVGKGLLVAFAAGLVCLAALFPLARVLDQRQDRQRPLYRDVLTMAWLQYDHLQKHDGPIPAELREGESTTIDGHRFTSSPGVTVRVKVSGDGFCVRGWNQYGDVTAWQCADRDTQPLPLGPLARLE